MTRLLIMGPPGAGKGTQAAALAEKLGIPAISTGDIFRRNIAEQTPLGVKVKSIIDSGQYVPDDLTNELVGDRISQDDVQNGFLLDGYPRTVEQVHALDAMLTEQGQQLDRVLLLTADTEALVQRLLHRAEQEGRTDDTPEVIRERMQVYTEHTAPLIELYQARGILSEVDGMGTIEEVREALLEAVAPYTSALS